MNSQFGLAQLNIARVLAPYDSPLLADFVANLERIYALAERSSGFVWRLQTGERDAACLAHFGEDIIVNMSVWSDVASLQSFVYQTVHVDLLRRRKEWFEKMREAHMVLWWVPRGHRPTIEQAKARLTQLRDHGPGPEAFTFSQLHAPPGQAASPSTASMHHQHPAV